MAQKHLRRCASIRRRLEKLEQELVEAIVAAQQSGESIRDIAPWAGRSPTRIHQLLREAARRQEEN